MDASFLIATRIKKKIGCVSKIKIGIKEISKMSPLKFFFYRIMLLFSEYKNDLYLLETVK